MEKKAGLGSSARELRRNAEARVAAQPVASPNETDTRRLVHELQVHQVELELQNEVLRQAQAELEESRDRYLDLYEYSPVGYLSLTPGGRIERINHTSAILLGRSRDALLQKPLSAFVTSEDHDRLMQLLHSVKRDGKRSAELDMRRSDGTTFCAQLDCRRDRSAGDLPANEADAGALGIRIALTDVSDRRHADDKLKLAASVFANAREGIMITTASGIVIDVNAAFTRITGYSRDEAVGQNPSLLSSGQHDESFYTEMWLDLTAKGHWYGETWNRRKNGEIYAEFQSISAIYDAQGVARQYVSLFSDITTLKEHEQQLEHLAHFDILTKLPNRALLSDRLRQVMTQTQRRGQHLAVAYLDLDGFKHVNDQHGHEIGDQVLMAVAERMKDALRVGDTLARLGGDEFVAVLLYLEDISASVPLLTRLVAAAAEPVHLGDLALNISASLGVTFYPQLDDADADQLLRQADQAMYQAKLAGKNRYHVFDAEQDRSVRGHHESLENIRQALERREFVLYFQPKVNMRSGTVIGAEALIRWQHPTKGQLLPAAFLPVVEDQPLSIEIGEWVIATTLAQMETWRTEGIDLPVSVNVGARQLQESGFVDRLKALLAAHPGVSPDRLELEVLETSALADLARAAQVIDRCRELGLGFALDDFGTGYSSLTYLKRLSVNLVKIDQSFVRGMLDDPDDLAILEGIIGLGTAFRRDVIAEGVETVEHGAMLLKLGCELAQGFGIAHPMLASELPAWLAAWRPDPGWVDQPSVIRDDLPLLFARVEHRAWIAAMEVFLRGERETAPRLDHRQCRFGVWLQGEGQRRHGGKKDFLAIAPLHRQVHAMAEALSQRHPKLSRQQALLDLEQLRQVRNGLIDQLKTLV